MFNNKRYLTKGIDESIPLELQLFMWNCIDRMPEPKDYLQVFERNRPITSPLNERTPEFRLVI